jgi:hypothetical protein
MGVTKKTLQKHDKNLKTLQKHDKIKITGPAAREHWGEHLLCRTKARDRSSGSNRDRKWDQIDGAATRPKLTTKRSHNMLWHAGAATKTELRKT